MRSRAENGKDFSIIAVAEGAMSVEEAAMKKKERAAFREESGFNGIANRVAKQLEEMVGVEARAVVPGHVQRGGSPSAYDRMLSTVFGVHAAQLIAAENYGQAVAMVGNAVSHNRFPRLRARRSSSPPTRRLSVPPEAWAFRWATERFQSKSNDNPKQRSIACFGFLRF